MSATECNTCDTKLNDDDKSRNFSGSKRHHSSNWVKIKKLFWTQEVSSQVQRLIVSYLVLNFLCSIVLNGVNGERVFDVQENTIDAGGHFTPQWAAHIPGGEHVAESVAKEHGYVIVTKVSEIKNDLFI